MGHTIQIASVAFVAVAFNASAQVSLTNFSWTTNGNAVASAAGHCALPTCVAQPLCTGTPQGSFTITGSQMQQLAASDSASRTCTFGCLNQGVGSSGGATSSAVLNVANPSLNAGVTQWNFGHQVNVGASAASGTSGCAVGELASAQAGGTHHWDLGFNLYGPTRVTLHYTLAVQRGASGGSATSSFRFEDESARPYLIDSIDVVTNPTAQHDGSVQWILPSGQYAISFDAGVSVGESVPNGQSRNLSAMSGGQVTLSFERVSCGCPVDIDDGTGSGTCDGGVDINDLLRFLECFQQGTTCADVDDDGVNPPSPDAGVDINDLLFFLVRFEAGC